VEGLDRLFIGPIYRRTSSYPNTRIQDVLIVYQVLQIELESDIKKWFAGKVLGEISSRGASSVEDIMATPDFESFLKKLVVEWIERSFASFDVVRFGELPDTKRFIERFVTRRFIEPLGHVGLIESLDREQFTTLRRSTKSGGQHQMVMGNFH
jgi:hypothetical protein